MDHLLFSPYTHLWRQRAMQPAQKLPRNRDKKWSVPRWKIIVIIAAGVLCIVAIILWIIGSINLTSLISLAGLSGFITFITSMASPLISLVQWLSSPSPNKQSESTDPDRPATSSHVPDEGQKIVPFPLNRWFSGREDILRQIDSELFSNRLRLPFYVLPTQSYVLSGMGGIGKTQIALEYAYRHFSQYETVIWLNADTRENLKVDAQNAANKLKLVPEEKPQVSLLQQVRQRSPKAKGKGSTATIERVNEEPQEPVRNTVRRGMATIEQTGAVQQGVQGDGGQRGTPSIEKADYMQLLKGWLENNTRWLLILDNVTDPSIWRDIKPKGNGGHILLTTRLDSLRESEQGIKIEKVSEEEGAQMLLKRADILVDKLSEDWKYATLVSEHMEGYPLALRHAGAYIDRNKLSVKDFLQEYKQKGINILEEQKGKNGSNGLYNDKASLEGYPKSVVVTLSMNFDDVRKNSMVSADLLLLCAFLDPGAIPEEIMLAGIDDIKSSLSTADAQKELDISTEILLGYSLLDRNPKTKMFNIHRMQQVSLKEKMDSDTQRSWAERTVRIISSVFAASDEQFASAKKDEQKPSPTQLYLPHAHVCTALIEEYSIITLEAINLLNAVGTFTYQGRKSAEAIQFYRRLLDITRQRQDVAPLDVARNLCVLAHLYSLQKEKRRDAYTNAKRMYNEALEIYEQVLGPDDPHIGQVLSHYAMLLRRMRHWKEAEGYAMRARLIWEKLTEQAMNRWRYRWLGNVDPVNGGETFVSWGFVYLLALGIPVAIGLVFQSWWLFLSSLAITLLASVATISDQVRHTRIDEGVYVGIGLSVLLGIVGGVAGWHAGNVLISWWHLGSWPVPLQFIIAGLLALLGFVLAGGGCLVVIIILSDAHTFPRYTLFPTLTYTLSTCALPVLLGVGLNSWWIGVGSFIVLMGLLVFLYSIWAKQIPRWRHLGVLIFSITWSALAWPGVSLIHLNSLLLTLPFATIALALLIFIIAFACHILAYTQFSIIGAEESFYFVLEDLWVDYEVEKLLATYSAYPIKDWQSFYRLRGEAYRQKLRLHEALADFKRVVGLYPTDPDAYNDLGNVYLDLRDYKRALVNYNRALKLDKRYVYYRNRGLVYANLKDYRSALDDCNEALKLDERYIDAYNDRGLVYFNLKNYNKALDDFREALKLDKRYVYAYRNRGLVYANLKDYKSALTDYNKALDLDAGYADAYLGRGYIFLWQKNIQVAHADFVLGSASNTKDLNLAWMVVWSEMTRERPGVAVAERLEAIALIDPQDYKAYTFRGVALVLRNKYPEALLEMEQSVAKEPDLEDSYFWKGMVCAYLGQDDAARSAIQRSLDIGLPPVLLRPLYWLERDRPRFYSEYAQPLLKRYDIE